MTPRKRRREIPVTRPGIPERTTEQHAADEAEFTYRVKRTIARLPESTRRSLEEEAAKGRRRGGEAGDALEQRNRQQLYDTARKLGIEGRSKMGKWELIDAIRAARWRARSLGARLSRVPARGYDPAGAMRTEGTGEHLVFVWSPAGYTIDVRPGDPPRPGASVDEGDRRQRVTKVAPSPLPGDSRACAYLLPADENGDVPDATAHLREPPVTIGVAVPPESDVQAADDFLTLLGRYPEGASVVTVDADGRRFGLTVGSLVSLSLDPPLVGFTVPNGEEIHEVLSLAGGCAISILAGGQEWLAAHFETSERPFAMWHGLAAEPGAAGAPLFVGALGWLECSLVETADLGSDTLFVCEVRELETSREAPALLRHHGRYDAV